MKHSLFQTRAFKLGFAVSFCLFGLLNAVRHQANWGIRLFDYFSPHGLWDLDAYGFPFIYCYRETGGPDHNIHFAVAELVVNVVTGFVTSILIGLGATLIASKFNSK